jgi:putative transposase
MSHSSSPWMGPGLAWQRAFGVFWVSASNVDAVIQCIRAQETHHRKMPFEEDLITFLQKHGVAFDPRYVFG